MTKELYGFVQLAMVVPLNQLIIPMINRETMFVHFRSGRFVAA